MAKHLGDNEISSAASTSPPPEGIDRRSFLMRNAVIGAAAVMTGTTWTPEARAAAGREGSGGARSSAPTLSPDLNVVKKSKGPVMTVADEFYKVGPGPLELAHDRADAHHLRFLPALHQTAGRPTRQGDGAEGAPVRQPQRHRQGTRHGARLARRAGRQGAGHRRSRCSSTSMRDKPDQAFPVKLGDKTFNLSASRTSSTTRPRATSRTRTR